MLLSRTEYYSKSKNLWVAGDPTTPCGLTVRYFFFSETKTKWNISPSDLVEDYEKDLKEILNQRTPINLINMVEQVFGYLGGGNPQFGAMSTYDYTWFLKRPKGSPGCLQVSDRIANPSISPSVLKCYVYAISLATEDPDSPSPPPPNDRKENNCRPRMMITTHRLMVTTAAATITLIRIRIRKRVTEAQTTISSGGAAYQEQGRRGLVLNRMGGMTMR
jgi:hypothetical protein